MRLLTRILLLALLFGCNRKPVEDVTAAEQPAVAAPAFRLQSLGGKTVSLSDFKGKVVFLDFWATWCPPCRVSTPSLVQLNSKFKEKDFAMVGISLDEDHAAVDPYVKKANIEHAVLFGAESSVEQDYRIRAIPSFFLLDKAGNIVKKYTGFHPEMADEWEKEISRLLDAKL